jgi:hypothetical protein
VTLDNDGLDYGYDVPEGHHWVIRNVMWCDDFSSTAVGITFKFQAAARFREFTGDDRHRFIVDYKQYGARPGNWEGRLAMQAGDQLMLGNYSPPPTGGLLINVSVHGFDFLVG